MLNTWLHSNIVNCRLKAALQAFSVYCSNHFDSGITLANHNRSWPSLVHVSRLRGNSVYKILGTTGPVVARWGVWTTGKAGVFCLPNHKTLQQLLNGRFSPNLATTCESMSPGNVSERILENFLFRRYLPPKKPRNWRGQTGTLLRPNYMLFVFKICSQLW